ncbi:MAG: histidine kinase [Schleiferiaceae bacterium]|nr:histidine kinase [Schleiferiaceae bacterium]
MTKALTFLLCFAVSVASGQFVEPFFKNYNLRDGLPADEVYASAVDRDGYMWFGTTLGLSRFDGYSFLNYQKGDGKSGMASNFVDNMAIAHDGKIWIGYFDGGLDLFDPTTGNVVFHLDKKSAKAPLADNRIISLYPEGDSLLFIGMGNFSFAVLHLKDTTLSTIKITPNGQEFDRMLQLVTQIAPTAEGDFWMTTGAGLIFWNRKDHTFSQYTYTTDKPYSATTSLLLDGDSGIYVSTWGGGLLYFNVNSTTWENYLHGDANTNMPANIFRKLARKSKTEIWVLSRQEGLGVFDQTTKKFAFPNPDPLDPNAQLSAWYADMTIDALGGVWTTHNRGISAFHEQNQFVEKLTFPPDHPNQEMGNIPICSCREGNYLWFGRKTSDYLLRLNTQTRLFDTPCALPSNTAVHVIIPHQSGFFLGSSNKGLLWVADPLANNATAEPISEALSQMNIYNGFIHPNGELFLATFNHGLVRYNIEKQTFKQYFPESVGVYDDLIPKSVFNCIADPTGDVWSCSSNGLMRLRINGDVFESFNQTNDALVNAIQPIRNIATNAKGKILLLSESDGVFVFEPGQPLKVQARYNTENYLESTINYTLSTTRNNELIVGSPLGIQVFDTDNEKNYLLNYKNGLRAREGVLRVLVDGNQFYLPESGKLYCVSLPRLNKRGLIKSRVVVSEVQKLNGEPLPYAPTARIVLPHKENAVNIFLTSLYYPNPEDVQFAYALRENGENWQVIKGNRLTLVNLESNDYPLWVKARQPDGSWTKPQLLLEFAVLPPFYKTWWFRLGVFLSLFTIGYIIYNQRVSYLLKTKQVEAVYEKQLAVAKLEGLRAQMNPHFLFNSLNSINFFILKGKIEEASGYLVMFSKLLRRVLSNSRSETVALADEIEVIRLYCALEALRFGKKFDYHFSIEEAIATEMIQIPPMIIQPFVENAIWHGLLHKETGDRTLEISVLKDGLDVLIHINDNGIGRRAAQALKQRAVKKHNSFGLKITEERFKWFQLSHNQKINFEIVDLEDAETQQPNGTRVIIRLFNANK